MQGLEATKADLQSDPSKLDVLFSEMIQMSLWFVDMFDCQSKFMLINYARIKGKCNSMLHHTFRILSDLSRTYLSSPTSRTRIS